MCLGNICRSPTAEAVLRGIAAREAPELALTVDSAGTANYHPGAAPDRRAQAAARRRDFDLSSLRARQVRDEDFMRFDLILAMDRSNLQELLRRAPAHSAPPPPPPAPAPGASAEASRPYVVWSSAPPAGGTEVPRERDDH